MKFALNIFLFLLVSFTLGSKSFSLNNYQIKNICKNQKNRLRCIKNLREKESKLQKGYFIEIPVIPFKR
jgi:hypothetical protein